MIKVNLYGTACIPCIADTGNMTRAADILHLVQTTPKVCRCLSMKSFST